MSNHHRSPTRPGGAVRRDPNPGNAARPAIRGPLTPEQMARWANEIASGQGSLPRGLSRAQEQQLQDQVRRLLRQQLVQFIARQIAHDIRRSARPLTER